MSVNHYEPCKISHFYGTFSPTPTFVPSNTAWLSSWNVKNRPEDDPIYLTDYLVSEAGIHLLTFFHQAYDEQRNEIVERLPVYLSDRQVITMIESVTDNIVKGFYKVKMESSSFEGLSSVVYNTYEFADGTTIYGPSDAEPESDVVDYYISINKIVIPYIYDDAGGEEVTANFTICFTEDFKIRSCSEFVDAMKLAGAIYPDDALQFLGHTPIIVCGSDTKVIVDAPETRRVPDTGELSVDPRVQQNADRITEIEDKLKNSRAEVVDHLYDTIFEFPVAPVVTINFSLGGTVREVRIIAERIGYDDPVNIIFNSYDEMIKLLQHRCWDYKYSLRRSFMPTEEQWNGYMPGDSGDFN